MPKLYFRRGGLLRMDLRETEKQIWLQIWKQLVPNDDVWDDELYGQIKDYFRDLGHLRSSAKERRFDEAMQIIRDKIWKNVPKKVREDVR